MTVRGEAYCWGDNLPAGALGDGSTIRRARSAPVSGGLKFARLWAGGHTTCAVDSLGTPYCWGENTYGQMGLGTTAPAQLVPVRAAGSLLFTQMAVGERNICGITPGAAAYCAGENQSGQLGDGDSVMKTVQTPVAGGHSFQSIAVSVWHTCGLNNLNAIYCWGWPSYWGSPSAGVQRTPTLAGAGYAFRAITLGLWFVCGVSTASKGYCWGIGTSGQLGTGDPGESSPALILASWAFQSVDATGSATACAIAASGAAYCWGANQWGQIGDGTTTTRWIPQPVLGGLTLSRVAVGVAHVCGVTPSGKVYCWGNNNTGALGNGVMGVDRWAPVAVLPPER
ncbi:MAG: hypothetical protein HY337_03140 [Gemmatimonadetes bacterium]|nr:hypothetical protein [Gemmatimonadota bacterium]